MATPGYTEIMTRSRHPKKEIERALREAEARRWRIEKASGSAHAWGLLLCPHEARDGCRLVVYGTPRVPKHHADRIRRAVERCPHQKEQDDNDDEDGQHDDSL